MFDASGNITNASANMLTISNGLIFADPAMTTLIGIMPGLAQSQVTIPSTVKAITGYQAAVVYDTTNGNIINPSFTPGKGLTIGNDQQLLDLGSVGAFQQVGKITPGAPAGGAAGRAAAAEATKPSMTDAVGLSTLTSINFANGSQLQTIGPKAFAGCSNLTSVSLPDSCNTIGAQAFQNCTSLQSINLKGVQYIGDAAFNNAFIASNNAIAVANPVTLNLSSAQYIGTGAFDSSKWNKKVISGNTTTLGDQVLSGGISADGTTVDSKETPQLSKISTVTFGNKLNTLNQYAFNGANYLTSADLSGCTSLATISNNAFRNTSNLTSVKFSNTIDTIGNSAFSGANLTGSLSFNTNGDLKINQSAFDTQALTSVDFSQVKGNITIGQNAFSKADTTNTSLTTLTLPAVVENKPITSFVMIGANAFQNCTSLKLPGTTTETGNYSMPLNLAYVAPNAFNNNSYNGITHDSYVSNIQFDGSFNKVAHGLLGGQLTNGTIYMGPAMFSQSKLTDIDLSNTNIQALNYGDMSKLSTLGAISIDSNQKQQGAFAKASQLQTLTLPASCNQFGVYGQTNNSTVSEYGTFANCTSLQNLNFKNFDVAAVGGTGDTAITAGFNQITQATWIQVANIMNALAYFGQQNIIASADGLTTANTIASQADMDKITYSVNADPLAEKGTWKFGGNTAFGTTLNAPWVSGRNNFNFPISAYPAGSYGYSVSAPTQEGPTQRADGDQITVNYPAGLGTAVDANFKGASGNAASPSTTVTMENSGNGGTNTLGFGSNNTNGPLLNGSGSSADTNVVFNTSNTTNNIQNGSIITITNGANGQSATRPQSVWYTVSASGQVKNGGPDDQATQMTQNNQYELTQDETNNIFAINSNQIAGFNNNNNTYGYTITGYSTAVGGTNVEQNSVGTAIPVNVPSANGLQTNNTTTQAQASRAGEPGTTITIAQNYLPLGITSAVKDAYFNHNGIIWHYHNGFAAGKNDGIWIEGIINSYIGGTIQKQGNGVMDLVKTANTTSNNDNAYTNSTTDPTQSNYISKGTYSNTSGNTSLTSVGKTSTAPSNIGNTCVVGLFGSKVTTDNVSANDQQYSATVAPKNVTVKLTLVGGTNNN